jgi:DNA integrity scanning protein DisA with diadenylate cyclase activity
METQNRGHNPNAEARVRRLQLHPKASGRVHQKTGNHWVADARRTAEAAKHVKRILKRIPTLRMVEECPEIELVASRFPSLWDLSEASRDALLELPGVGEKRLMAIQVALLRRNVRIRWQA